ncbi:transglutaminase [Salinigranum rubrum]|uniref:Transglutaminase n=1 Tax=Salinigranum rubrum TaxID=755307 RepID=A0A2I8VN16_9EURY|nr:transglutaminaseTgpA domain-containing protein [Salinigranum rubrum]AUV83316.1 transglutaminase [Salinigranum rubrum]
MSADTRRLSLASLGNLEERTSFRGAALVGVLVLTLSYLSVLSHVTNVVGGNRVFVLLVVGTFLLATALGRFLRVRTAVFFTAVLLVGGTVTYFLAIPASQLSLLSTERLLSDTVALLTGLSVLRLTAADVWALAVAPGPVFLSWYLAMRERYAWSVAVGGTALGLFVLTGDAGTATTLVGVLGAGLALGLGTLDRHGGTVAQLDTLVAVLAAMVVLAATLSVVPGGAAQPLLPDRGSPTVEASLVNSPERIEMLGSIRLSPQVRYTVEANERQYWQTASYDRYTGDGWVRTGDTDAYRGRLAGPPGASRQVTQTVTAEATVSAMPAAWKPVSVSGDVEGRVRITQQGFFVPATSLASGESYTVESRVPQYTSEQLRRAGTDYPDAVRTQYLQLPESTSTRVRERAAEIAGGEDNAYDKAVAIEQWLEENKRYSLTVERPEGDVAEAFLFEMDAGYCTYYATAMVTLLRTQGVPARLAVGYTPGEEVGNGEYVVRGLDSHAWVEVYFPDVGWVRFDPTPATPRETAERTRLTEARQSGEPGVDTNGTEPETDGGPTVTPFETNGSSLNNSSQSDALRRNIEGSSSTNATPLPAAQDGNLGGETEESEGFQVPDLPSRETLGLGLVAFVGLVAGARRLGFTAWLAAELRLRYQRPTGDAAVDAERAFDRLERLLERRYRARRPTETPRAYIRALGRGHGLDPRVERVADVYERSHYGSGVSPAEAERAVALVDDLAWEATPVVGELFSRGEDEPAATTA